MSIVSLGTQRQRGFTIVELLIVIVVVAILAAITVVAYNGIQGRARNAQQLAAAKSYLTAFSAYVAASGAYPPTSKSRVCLNLEQAECMNGTAWYRDATLEAALKTVLSPLPAPNTSIALNATPRMGYIPVTDVTLDGTPAAFLLYTVESPETCSVGTPVSGTWPNYSSTPPASGYTSGGVPGTRVCFVAVPKP